MKTCPSCGEENADRARFCQNCATPLEALEPAAAEVRKVVTVVFADVTGSTALGERLDPEALRRVMARYFEAMSAAVERHGGTVEKFIGDAVMAIFGIPRLHEDDPLRAVRAAVAMRDALAALNVDLAREHGVSLEVRIGVNTGEVVAGDPATGQRLVTGDAVNVAARLEQASAPGEILLGETTHRLVRDAVQIEPIEPLELKGKAERVRAHRLVAVREDVAGHTRRLDSPIVGRDRELGLLERALERATAERTCHLFTLLGPAGVGKSRLVQEFLADLGSSARTLRGRCLSYGEGITFFPLAEIVEQAAGIERSDDLETARARLAELVAGADARDRICQLVAGLLSWDGGGTAEEAFWGVRKLLEHLARDAPLVVIVDDVHRAEPTLLDLLDHLADWIRDVGVLLLAVARSELLEVRPAWAGGKLNATTILLEPLDANAASLLLDNLLRRAVIPAAARARILQAAEGNPLFVEEMLAMLIDDGLLRFEDGAWRAAPDLAGVAVPPTIQLLLAARLDRLDPGERAVIERGAVEGSVFHAGAVTNLAPEPLRPKVRAHLFTLARKELIRPDRAEFAGEDAFRFRHLLIRDAAYQALPKEQRADLHERFARWLERAAGDRLLEYEEILAHHLEQAYRYRLELGPPDPSTRELGRAATDRLLSSAERARERGDHAAARALLGSASEIADGPQRARALLELAATLFDANEYRSGAEAAARAVEASEAAGERALAIRAALLREESIGQFEPSQTIAQVLEAAEEAIRKLDAIGDDPGIVQATLVLARHHFYAGSCERSVGTMGPLLDRAPELPQSTRRRLARMLSTSAYFGPMPVDEAFRLHERAFDLAEDSILAHVYFGTVRMGLLAMRGDAEGVREWFERIDRLIEEIGDLRLVAPVYQVRGEANRFLGWSEAAEREFRTGVEVLEGLGETGYNSTMSALLALSLCDEARFEEADVHAARSRELSAEDDFSSQTGWRMAQARILSNRARHGEAVALAAEAIDILSTTDYLVWQAEGHETLGTVLAAAGRTQEARAPFREALDRYQRKGVVPLAARIAGRLSALG